MVFVVVECVNLFFFVLEFGGVMRLKLLKKVFSELEDVVNNCEEEVWFLGCCICWVYFVN